MVQERYLKFHGPNTFRGRTPIMPGSRLRLVKKVEHACNWTPTWFGETMWQGKQVHTRHSFIVDTSKIYILVTYGN